LGSEGHLPDHAAVDLLVLSADAMRKRRLDHWPSRRSRRPITLRMPWRVPRRERCSRRHARCMAARTGRRS
jgi:hypothetical protein